MPDDRAVGIARYNWRAHEGEKCQNCGKTFHENELCRLSTDGVHTLIICRFAGACERRHYAGGMRPWPAVEEM